MIPPRARLALTLTILLAGEIPGIAATPLPPPSPQAIETETADLSMLVATFSRDLERLRRFMGVPEVSALDIGICGALPRDLYFQTLTLWKQTDRLLFEILREHASPPSPPPGDIGLRDTLSVLQDAHRLLRQVMRELQVADGSEPMLQDKTAPADLFAAILALNRQLNPLLERHIAPSDVYMEVTLAVAYAARLLARYPDAIRIPAEPAFEPDQQPRDVYARLIACLQTITRIFGKLGLAVLDVDPSQTALDALAPGDVFLVATLIVSQLDFLYKRLGVAKPPPQPIYPGIKYPAHTYQRAGILLAQLAQLERFIAPDNRLIPALPNSP